MTFSSIAAQTYLSGKTSSTLLRPSLSTFTFRTLHDDAVDVISDDLLSTKSCLLIPHDHLLPVIEGSSWVKAHYESHAWLLTLTIYFRRGTQLARSIHP